MGSGHILIFDRQSDHDKEPYWATDHANGKGIYCVQEWTGQKDRYGVDIYEGDRITSLYKGLKNEDTVVWENRAAGFSPFDERADSYWYGFDLEEKDLEVIGNIFNTPQ